MVTARIAESSKMPFPLPPLPLGYAGADLGIHFGFEYTGQ